MPENTNAPAAVVAPAPADPKAAPVVETKAPSPKEDPKMSARFALLSKKEQAIVREKEALKVEREKFAGERAEVEAYRVAREKAKGDPIAALEHFGHTYEGATQYMLNDKHPTADLGVKAVQGKLETLEQELARLREERSGEEKKRKDAEERATVAEFNKQIFDAVKAGGDKYELVNTLGQQELVSQLVQTHFEQTGALLLVDDAARMAESYLEEQFEKARSTKKFAAKSAAPKATSESASQPGSGSGDSPRTLTNNLGFTTATRQTGDHLEEVAEKLRLFQEQRAARR